ncbi:hypothetical protein CYMTET_27208 [Cymbomonas tetramitiformis]|uniref:Lipoyl-binding domain-containing protein n=1 Tax=Cymbomonas tetramitiformis TaxID=36881 RepID=A0AAE0FQI6_9CHLO|nr:hypothetical protein CYMTET_27208 [Cymbomonas tetramitiformis]
MRSGRITKWHVDVGNCVDAYDLMFELETDHLTEREDETLTMEVESQELGYLAKILVPLGEEIQVDTPIAVVCDNEEDLPFFKDFSPPETQDEAFSTYRKRPFLWQAYTKGKSLDM